MHRPRLASNNLALFGELVCPACLTEKFLYSGDMEIVKFNPKGPDEPPNLWLLCKGCMDRKDLREHPIRKRFELLREIERMFTKSQPWDKAPHPPHPTATVHDAYAAMGWHRAMKG